MLNNFNNTYGGVAQTVEQQVEALCVGGAIPSPFTNICRTVWIVSIHIIQLGTTVPVLLHF